MLLCVNDKQLCTHKFEPGTGILVLEYLPTRSSVSIISVIRKVTNLQEYLRAYSTSPGCHRVTMQRRVVWYQKWSVPAVPLDTGTTVPQPVHLLPHGSQSAPTSTSRLRPHPSIATGTLQVQLEMAHWCDYHLPRLERDILETDQTDTAPENE